MKAHGTALEGIVSEVLPSALFRIALPHGRQLLATRGARMRTFSVRIHAGDRVTVEVSPDDQARGRITVRHRPA